MEFSVFVQGYNPAWLRPDLPPDEREHEALIDDLEVVLAAEKAGFKYAWVSEHHFLDEYSHVSASEVSMAYLFGRTSKIHIGSAIMNLMPKVRHPVRTAEQVALLDHYSEGRFEFGTGRGAGSREVTGFGVEGTHVTKEIYDEVLPQMFRMWKDEPYSYEGKSFSVPERNVLPRPYTKPHPPVWLSAGNTPTYEKAARLGLGVIGFFLSGIDGVAPHVAKYKETVSKAEPVGEWVNDNVMLATRVVCLEDGKRAREVYKSMRPGYHRSLVYRYHDTFPHPPNAPVWPEKVPEPDDAGVEKALAEGYAIGGDPDEVIKQLKRYEAAGVDQISVSLPFGASRETAHEIIETFGKYVIPEFDKDPVHRTTRNRERSA